MVFNSVEDAREFFSKDKFATTNGMVIDEIGEDYAICSMTVGENHLNAAGSVMGGVYFTLADFAFAVSVNNVHKITVGMDSNITFLVPAKGDKLIATSKVIRSGKTTTFCEVEVKDGLDRLCAVFTGTAFKL
ncbi:MAG: PaaI family thioesterase [Lachnospiraceae bacterium]|nr:PaaI family thioesterase [Lachnospiraceae bacterium]